MTRVQYIYKIDRYQTGENQHDFRTWVKSLSQRRLVDNLTYAAPHFTKTASWPEIEAWHDRMIETVPVNQWPFKLAFSNSPPLFLRKIKTFLPVTIKLKLR